MFAPEFPVLELDSVMRRTIVSAVIVGALSVLAAFLAGQPLIAPGVVLGLGMGLVNHRVFQSSAMRYTTPEGSVKRKPFAGSVFLRLGLCTAVAIGLLVIARPVGWGVIAGLVIFQLLMMVNSFFALLRYQREQHLTGSHDD